MRIHTIISSSIVFLLIISLLTTSCSSSSDSSASSGITTSTASLGTSVKNVPLVGGIQSEISFTFTLPGKTTTGDISAKGDATVNVAESMQNVTISSSPITNNSSRFETLRLLAYALIKNAFATETAELTVYISYAGDTDVCNSPYKYGPYNIVGMIGGAISSDTTAVALTQPTVDIVNSGSLEICMVTTPPIDAYLTVTDVVVDFAPCEAPTVDVVGSWSGDFQCTSFDGVPDLVDSVLLHITQNTDGSYHYDDSSGASYDGNLCGNKLKYKGGLAGQYTESGTFVFSSSTDSTKTSVYNNIFPLLGGGTCSDTLQKI